MAFRVLQAHRVPVAGLGQFSRFSSGAVSLARQVNFDRDTPDETSHWYQPPTDARVVFSSLANTTTLDVKVTQQCNLKCPMCIDDKSSDVNIDFSRAREFLEKAKLFEQWQVRGLAIGGGEPLYRNKEAVLEFIKWASQNGYYTTINTNGLLLKDRDIEAYHRYLNLIHLPLDGSTAEVQNEIRTSPAVLKKTVRNIKKLNEVGYEGLIKVATVATAINTESIPGILNIFEDERLHFDIWRLYQFRAHGMGRLAADDLTLATADFEALVERLQQSPSPYAKKLAPNLTSEYIRKLFLLPTGELSIGNTKLGFDFGESFQEELFFELHKDHLWALEKYITGRIDKYEGVSGRVFRVDGVRLDEKSWSEYYEQRIARRGGLGPYFEHKVASNRVFLSYVLGLAAKASKPIIESGCGSGSLSCYLAQQGLKVDVHACDADPRVLKITQRMAQEHGAAIRLQRADIKATHMPRAEYSVSFNHGVMEHFDTESIRAIITEQTRIADVFVMCVPTAASGAQPSDYFGDERYLTCEQWDAIIESSGCEVLHRFGSDARGLVSAESAPFVTYVLASRV